MVAIKVLPASVAADPDRIARFEREAHAVAALSHPNILAIHDFGHRDGIPYAIDFCNPAPDADLNSIGEENFEWIVNAVADLAVKKATEPAQPATYRWDALLKG